MLMIQRILPINAAILAGIMIAGPVSGDNWPRWLGPEGDSVWCESGIIDQFPPGGPPVRWRTPIGSGYSGPSVAGNSVYVMDRLLDSGAANPANPFDRGSIPGKERVLCLSDKDGSIRWIHEYPCAYTVSYAAGPRTTPVVDTGKVFTLGAEGHLFCLEAESGEVVWERRLNEAYSTATPTWGYAATPLVTQRYVITLAGGQGSTVVALNRETGREEWRALSAEEPGYSPPILIQAGDRQQLIVWHPEAVQALDPDSGAVLWQVPWKIRSGLSVATPRYWEDHLFFTSFYSGSLMLRLDPDGGSPATLWRSPKASEKDTTYLHALITTPFLEAGYLYGVGSYGQLRGLRVADGERLWETFQATGGDSARWATAFLVKHRDRFFLFNEQGDLILARLTPDGYHEIDRAHILEPNGVDLRIRSVVWSHPAFAHQNLYARNDSEIVSISLAKQ